MYKFWVLHLSIVGGCFGSIPTYWIGEMAQVWMKRKGMLQIAITSAQPMFE